jgi:hypothetical protein
MTSESRNRDTAESVRDVATRQVWEETYSILCSETFLKDRSIVIPLKCVSIVIVGPFGMISSSSLPSFSASLLSTSGISNDHSFLFDAKQVGGVLKSTVAILVFWLGPMANDLTRTSRRGPSSSKTNRSNSSIFFIVYSSGIPRTRYVTCNFFAFEGGDK